MKTYAQVLVVFNPVSSHAARVRKRITELRKLFGAASVTVLETTPDPLAFQTVLVEKLANGQGQTLLCIGGGDGTVHLVANSLLQAGQLPLNHLVLLPLWGGNANDLAGMLNGRPSSHKKLDELLRRGHPVNIHPLQIIITTFGVPVTHYAVCYASFGASAYAAKQLAAVQPAKTGRLHAIPAVVLTKEFFNIVLAFARAPTFRAEQDGQPVEIFEQIFTNGSRLAKLNSWPVRLSDAQFYHALEHTKPSHTVLGVLKMLTGRSFGSLAVDERSFTVKEPILAQFDGEVLAIPSDSTLTISIAEPFLAAWSTKL